MRVRLFGVVTAQGVEAAGGWRQGVEEVGCVWLCYAIVTGFLEERRCNY
jgi:hypothetical protein